VRLTAPIPAIFFPLPGAATPRRQGVNLFSRWRCRNGREKIDAPAGSPNLGCLILLASLPVNRAKLIKSQRAATASEPENRRCSPVAIPAFAELFRSGETGKCQPRRKTMRKKKSRHS
jgi:hypothetical protein